MLVVRTFKIKLWRSHSEKKLYPRSVHHRLSGPNNSLRWPLGVKSRDGSTAFSQQLTGAEVEPTPAGDIPSDVRASVPHPGEIEAFFQTKRLSLCLTLAPSIPHPIFHRGLQLIQRDDEVAVTGWPLLKKLWLKAFREIQIRFKLSGTDIGILNLGAASSRNTA